MGNRLLQYFDGEIDNFRSLNVYVNNYPYILLIFFGKLVGAKSSILYFCFRTSGSSFPHHCSTQSQSFILDNFAPKTPKKSIQIFRFIFHAHFLNIELPKNKRLLMKLAIFLKKIFLKQLKVEGPMLTFHFNYFSVYLLQHVVFSLTRNNLQLTN